MAPTPGSTWTDGQDGIRVKAKTFVILSGIPASGKTETGRRLADELSMPFLDKDHILESLFETLGTGDLEWRRRLSRASDAILQRVAPVMERAVLCSFWRHPAMQANSGTPIHWLAGAGHSLIEVYCRCDPATAADRFASRSRHPGHLDADRAADDFRRQCEHLAVLGPLNVGRLIELDTNQPIVLERVAADVRRSWAS